MDKVILYFAKITTWFHEHPKAAFFASGFGLGFIIGIIL
jgi:hypothetical protein